MKFKATNRTFQWLQLSCMSAALVCLSTVAQADEDAAKRPQLDKPEVTVNTGVDENEGAIIPMDLMFRDTDGRLVELGSLFDGSQPVMLSFNYSNCPKLCSVQLENMTLTLREVAKRFKIDDDFQVISVSIDPNEQTVRMRETQDKYINLYNQPGTENGWHFLNGERKSIAKLADVCGFRYRYIARQKYYSHPPVFILLSPEGKIVRYIHGLKYDQATMEQALIEAAEGKIGSPINRLSYGMGCFIFDESTGQYTFQAMAIMRIGAFVTVIALVVSLVPYWILSRRRPRVAGPAT
jgi:protein SCO1/2